MRELWTRGSIYFSEHVCLNAFAHVFAGLGIAWLVSLFWCYSTPVLLAGVLSLVVWIAIGIHALVSE
jgi:hypothetical protein